MCNRAKSTSYQAERNLFLYILQSVDPSGLRLSSQPAPAPQADAQGGKIVQRGGGGWWQDSGGACGGRGAVEGKGTGWLGGVGLHRSQGGAGRPSQVGEAAGGNGDVRKLPGDGGAVGDGDGRMRLG